jgi:hypothetical protein
VIWHSFCFLSYAYGKKQEMTMGIGKVIALDDLLDNARRRAIRLELSAMSERSNLTDRANIELLSNQLEAAQRLLREISEPEALAS